MNDLVQWLRAQLADDERIARAAHAPNWSTDGRRGLHYGVEDEWITDALTTADADHMARHDPARVLREIDAKRQVIAEHDVYGRKLGERMDCQSLDFPCRTLRLLALPYADRPGYRPDWRP
ncbi:DUF6221 family protein [Streptomyces tendae]|uniref:DUF6221 family protein n=1 Tax=Streptomyces tendae TaxID=1932 RepID=UPI003661B991